MDTKEQTYERGILHALRLLLSVLIENGRMSVNDAREILNQADDAGMVPAKGHPGIEPIETPTKPGWYLAKMKTWPIDDGYAPVKVASHPYSATGLAVWQCGDERPWQIEQWDWRARLYP